MRTRPLEQVADLPIAAISSSPFQARVALDEEHIAGLAESIAENELTSSILVRPIGDERYELVCGAHRLAAHQLLKRSHIRATIRPLSDKDAARLGAADNMHRRDLSDWEVCGMVTKLLERDFATTDKDVASLIGRPRTYVTKVRAFNDLPPGAAALVASHHRLFGANLAADLRASGLNQKQPQLVTDALSRVVSGALTQAGVMSWLRSQMQREPTQALTQATVTINDKLVRIAVYKNTIRISCDGMDALSVESKLREALQSIL